MEVGERGDTPIGQRDSHKSEQEAYAGKWSSRFTWAAIIQGSIVAILTAMLAIITATTEFPQKLVE